jgi:hypothetical protein
MLRSIKVLIFFIELLTFVCHDWFLCMNYHKDKIRLKNLLLIYDREFHPRQATYYVQADKQTDKHDGVLHW